MEKRYDFKRELLNVHKPGLRDFSRKPKDNEFVVSDGLAVVVPKGADKVIMNAVRDFESFLFISMKTSAFVTENDADYQKKLVISLNSDIEEASGYMGYRIIVGENVITLEGYDNRGVAQGLYFLEDLMSVRRAPYLKKETIKRKSVFERRTTQSSFGMFEWTDEALAHIAHMGMNCISLWIKDVNLDKRGGFLDINLLVERCEKYGISVGIGLYAKHNFHPDDEGALEFYEKLYGPILTACPKIQHIGVVGEATEFCSRDPRAGLAPRLRNFVDNIPTGKTTPGWFPCNDYPQWVDVIKKAARKFIPNLEVQFATYNWGFADEKDRIDLINNLPTDITLQPTWDMFEQRQMKSTVQDGVDYSLNFVGPGSYFVSEAKAAKARGIRLSTNAQSSGRTWDFGTVPYEPMPYQWMKRYEGMVKAHYEWGLDCVLENIHYGFQPSIISELEKYMFFTPYEGAPTPEEWLKLLIARDFGDENVDAVDAAMRDFSEAITHYPATNEDQYGAFRTGPAYPLWIEDPRIGLTNPPEQGKKPNEYNAMFGNGIYFPAYTPDVAGRNSLPGVRIYDEIELIEELRALLEEGRKKLEAIANPNENLKKLIALAGFMINSCKTAVHVKKLYIALEKLHIAGSREVAAELLDEIEAIIRKERENVLDSIPIVQTDSRLGWEASMEYQADEQCLRWKLRQLDYELNFTLPKFRKSNSL